MTFWLRRLLCHHLPITKHGKGRVQTACFLCGKPLGAGWDLTDLRPPVRCVPPKPRTFEQWTRVHGRSA